MTNDSRTGAFWDRHNERMQDPEYEARFNTEIARIRAVDAQVNANDDLRTALTKLAEKWFAPDAVASRLTKSATQGLVPVSDTRREDVARVDRLARVLHSRDVTEDDAPDRSWQHQAVRYRYRAMAEAVLARPDLVVPAPSVVDEAEVRERIAQDIEAEAERMILTSDAWTRGEERHLAGYSLAARIARGVTR